MSVLHGGSISSLFDAGVIFMPFCRHSTSKANSQSYFECCKDSPVSIESPKGLSCRSDERGLHPKMRCFSFVSKALRRIRNAVHEFFHAGQSRNHQNPAAETEMASSLAAVVEVCALSSFSPGAPIFQRANFCMCTASRCTGLSEYLEKKMRWGVARLRDSPIVGSGALLVWGSVPKRVTALVSRLWFYKRLNCRAHERFCLDFGFCRVLCGESWRFGSDLEFLGPECIVCTWRVPFLELDQLLFSLSAAGDSEWD